MPCLIQRLEFSRWRAPGELYWYKIMSVTILDRGEVCAFLKSGRFFLFNLHFFKAANYVDVHQSFLLPLGKAKTTVTL